MRRWIVLCLFVFLTGTTYSQKEKLAEVVMQSFEEKNYKLLFPHLVPDSVLLKPGADTSAKGKKTDVQVATLYRVLQESQWETQRKEAKKNKIDFKTVVIKEVVFQKTTGAEGNLYIHYANGEKHRLMKIAVMVIGDKYYIEYNTEKDESFVERDETSIEAIVSKYRATPVQ